VSDNGIRGLTAPERETIIGTSDADDYYDIWTAQRPVITKLKKNPAAALVEEGFYGTTAWARFQLPANLLTFRSAKRTVELTDEQRAERRERLARVRRGVA
jgi:hypothetical protein